MSCEGWGVGDRCRAKEDVHVKEKMKTGEFKLTAIAKGEEGLVREKYADVHRLKILWLTLMRELVLEHDQIHLLEKVGLAFSVVDELKIDELEFVGDLILNDLQVAFDSR